MDKPKNIKDMLDVYDYAIERGLYYHHSAWRRGYISRKVGGSACEYSGKFGRGIIVSRPSWSSSQYYRVDYWVEE